MKKKILVVIAILAVLSSPWWAGAIYIGGALISGKIDEVIYRPTTKFSPKKWKKPNQKYRYAVLDTVANTIITTNMINTEVIKLLGQPDSIGTNNVWQYETKRVGWRFIDFSGGGLALHFTTNQLVNKIEINTWID